MKLDKNRQTPPNGPYKQAVIDLLSCSRLVIPSLVAWFGRPEEPCPIDGEMLQYEVWGSAATVRGVPIVAIHANESDARLLASISHEIGHLFIEYRTPEKNHHVTTAELVFGPTMHCIDCELEAWVIAIQLADYVCPGICRNESFINEATGSFSTYLVAAGIIDKPIGNVGYGR